MEDALVVQSGGDLIVPQSRVKPGVATARDPGEHPVLPRGRFPVEGPIAQLLGEMPDAVPEIGADGEVADPVHRQGRDQTPGESGDIAEHLGSARAARAGREPARCVEGMQKAL